MVGEWFPWECNFVHPSQLRMFPCTGSINSQSTTFSQGGFATVRPFSVLPMRLLGGSLWRDGQSKTVIKTGRTTTWNRLSLCLTPLSWMSSYDGLSRFFSFQPMPIDPHRPTLDYFKPQSHVIFHGPGWNLANFDPYHQLRCWKFRQQIGEPMTSMDYLGMFTDSFFFPFTFFIFLFPVASGFFLTRKSMVDFIIL